MINIEELKKRLNAIEELLESDDDSAQTMLFDFEIELESLLDQARDNQYIELQKLLNNIKGMKNTYDVFDQEAELDMMFPNRHDEDYHYN